MKSLLFLIICVVSTMDALAQDPQLFENPWYLHKITIEDVDLFPPYDGLANLDSYFSENPSYFSASFCDVMAPPIQYEGATVFNLGDRPVILLGFCDDPASLQYDNAFFSIFFENRNFAKNPFNYTITEENNVKMLVITNAEGNKAFFGDELLAIKDIESQFISLFPNPATSELTISSNNTALENISIFNLQGQKVMTVPFQLNEQAINISNLQSGVYFLKAESDTGQQFVAKFVKQ